MQVPVVDVVDVIAVRYGDVTAPRAVLVGVVRVRSVRAGQHGKAFFLPRDRMCPVGEPALPVLTAPVIRERWRKSAGNMLSAAEERLTGEEGALTMTAAPPPGQPRRRR
ncbi:hypothetical protein GCM10010359_05720 [Streptomyces morookaense]|nr:hypothetical protein GCM10010359_05720 [Streptomyces morookaense]